jgi:FtsP/CotA-like multicopper oxidase with cupredoxin domain
MRRNGAVVNQIKSNPGLWMARCHIAERLRSGVMFSFSVARDWEQAR